MELLRKMVPAACEKTFAKAWGGAKVVFLCHSPYLSKPAAKDEARQLGNPGLEGVSQRPASGQGRTEGPPGRKRPGDGLAARRNRDPMRQPAMRPNREAQSLQRLCSVDDQICRHVQLASLGRSVLSRLQSHCTENDGRRKWPGKRRRQRRRRRQLGSPGRESDRRGFLSTWPSSTRAMATENRSGGWPRKMASAASASCPLAVRGTGPLESATG